MKYGLLIGIIFLSIFAKTNTMEKGEKLIKIPISPRNSISPETSPQSVRKNNPPLQTSGSEAFIHQHDIPKDFHRNIVKLTVPQATKQPSSSSGSSEEKK